jgi:hypothetical protein
MMDNFALNPQSIEKYEEAKEMQREQIQEAFRLGVLNENAYNHVGKRIHENEQEYYNQTYKNL